ncbi:MAG: hypothetical protein KF813_05805 [Trueperaceae bacterium]|nr:hypothetical protein [Trueperaceae bacterium]
MRIFPIRASTLLLIVLALLAHGGAQGTQLAPGRHQLYLLHGDRERTYHVLVPTQAARGAPLPVLLAFHGGGGNPDQFRRQVGLDELAEREGVVVVYPAGTGRGQRNLLTWNAGVGCCAYARDANVDDVGFVLALLTDLSNRLRIDDARIYATGHSNGAGMVYRLAAQAPGVLAAIAPVAGASMGIDRSLAQPIPLLHIHSVDDPRALYLGGLNLDTGTDTPHEHSPVPNELAFWVNLNGCGPEPELLELRSTAGAAGDGSNGDPPQLAEQLAWPCPASTPVVHWRLSGVGHGWPGTTHGIRPPAGNTTELISATDEIWSFLSRFQRADE